MPHIKVDGDELHFTDQGEGPLVLLVHGSCGSRGQWKRFIGEMGSGWRTVAVDLLGCGASTAYPLERAWDANLDAKALGALMDDLDEPFHFVGHSAGCLYSWEPLRQRPDQIKSLTLFEPVFFDLLREFSDPREDWPIKMAKGYCGRVDAGDMDGALEFFIDEWAGQTGTWQATPDPVKDMLRLGGGRLYYEWRTRMRPEPLIRSADLAHPIAPTLLIEGADTIPAVQGVMDLFATSRPGMIRHTIKAAGHMLPFTHADQAAALTLPHIRAAI